MDKIKKMNGWGNVCLSVMRKITEYSKPKLPKIRLFIVPTLTTILMKV